MQPRPRVSPVPRIALLGLALLGLAASACSHEVAPLGCFEDSECVAGEMCVSGSCVPERVTACQSDEQCDGAGGERCLAGVCQVAAGATGGTCQATRDCPSDRYCNTAVGQCQALLAGWCRQESQCAGEAPICSATTSDVPGRCVECLVDGDCAGGTCVNPGVCEAEDGGGSTPIGNDNPIGPGGNNTPPEDDPCAVNEWYGDGICDDFCPLPDPDCEGGGGGGGGDICAEYGWYGDGECDEFCPQPDPDCEGGGGGGGGQCSTMGDCWDAGYSIDYTCSGQGTCVCDEPWLNIICDDGYDLVACECTTGGGTPPPPPPSGLAENESCVTNSGEVLECAAGLDCIYATNGSGTPIYGGCKQICTANAQCGGGRQCALGFLAGGDGICGTPLLENQGSCQFWEAGSSFCFDPSAPTGANSAFLECLNGTCGFVCDYAGNTGASFTCPNSRQCSTSFNSYTGFGVDLAKCQ